MSEILKKWLNEEIHLSKEIKEISEDFKNGHLFAELLFKLKQIHNLSQFKDSNNKKDIINNFCLLNKTFLDMGIFLNEKDRNEIMNGGVYTSKIYLLKIRQVLSKKYINLEQLKYKYSNDLQKLYNKMYFNSQNDRYLYNLKIRLENEKNNNALNSNNSTKTEGNEISINKKYSIGGILYNQLKKKYSHLNLSDFELEIILLDMKDEEIKLNDLKEKIQKLEKKREKQCLNQEKKEIKNWNSSIIEIKKYKNKLIKESWDPVIKFQKGCSNYFKKNALMNEKITKSFENDLNFFVSEKNNEEEYEENDEIDLKKNMEVKNEIYMRQIKEKLEEKIKSKKDREKRERKRLKEEREMFERINTEKNMSSMIKNMENILNKGKIISVKGDELIAKTEKLMREVSPIERKRIKKMDELINREINKENRLDEKKNIISNEHFPSVQMNITNFIKQQNKEKEIENKVGKNDIDEKEKEVEETKGEGEGEEGDNNIKEDINKENKESINAEKSSYSKLTENDYGLNLINDSLKMHNNINDRIKLFKTRLMNTDNSDKYLPSIPSLPDIYGPEEDNNSKKQKSESHIITKSTSKNNINIFDKESFYEEMNKLNYENFLKESNERKIKKEKKNKIIKPIIDKIIEINEYIYIYQENKGIQLIDNTKWDELMDKFINWEDINDKEEEEIITEEEESEYLYDYGDKLTENDNLILFDYINYLNIFNDLIIPTSLRGKKYHYYELYEDVYNSLNNDVDIKEYEPNEDEIENLILPKSPNFVNYKFYDIIENVFKNKYNPIQNNNLIAININDNNSKKGKYFYLPIKISIIGYPLSGKKIQSHLINNKYTNIKIFDPQEIFESKLEEYKELKEPVEKKTKNKNMKPNQLDQLNKEREEKLEQFKPIQNIIQPYLDFYEKSNEKNLNEVEFNNKEDILTDVYINLLIYELDKIYPDDKESKNKLLDDMNEKYKQYISTKEQIKEIKKNEEENKKDNEDKGGKNKKTAQNFSKDLENLNKQLESIIPSLYVGFIFINFPKNVEQAKKLENRITGYISEFEKPKDIIDEKLFNYDNILDVNIKQKKSGSSQISMFDLFINLNITSEEVDHRYKVSKYDPTTKRIYNMEENPPSDKKIIEKLLPGVPNCDIQKLNEEKELYEKNFHNLTNFYKIMSNGMKKIYNNVEQMNKIYAQKINTNIETLMEEIIFENYYKNIEIVINDINKSNNNTNNEKEEEIKDEEEKNDIINKNEDDINNNSNNQDNQNNSIKKEESNKDINKNEKKVNNINIKEMQINTNTYNFSEDILNQFEKYGTSYKSSLVNFLHFISRQKEHIISNLTQIQNNFVLYLNRKTDKTSIAQIYIDKYNSIFINHHNLFNNPKVYNELLSDIEDVGKSVWLKIQNKKNEDVNYLKNIKDTSKLDSELQKFWEFILYIIEAEVKKYLITCEIIIKYYLNQTGLLINILGIFENNSKINESNEYLFKINHLKYLFKGIDNIPEQLHIINQNNNICNEEDGIKIENNKKEKEKENEVIMEDENEIENNNKNKIDNEEERKKDELNESKTEKNMNSKKINEKEKTIDEKLEILFMNSLKIIIRQDLLMKQYKEKLKSFTPNNEKEIKSHHKNSINKLLNSSISSRSSHRKSKLNKISKNGFILYEEEFTNQIKIEKQKFKYRLMFLRYFIIKYYNTLIECFNSTYNAMDDWIIMSVRSQNNSLNEFVSYLKKLLSKSNKKASLEDFEFDNFDIYKRFKIDISFIFDKMNLNSIVNLKNKKNKTKNEILLINENDMSYLDKYIYNINDLMYIYNYLKTFGTEGCEYLVKYEIVKEILIHQYFSKKKYGDLSNINKISNNNSENDGNSFEINKDENNNNSFNLFKYNNFNNIKLNDENNGIPKMVLFISNINYINFLNKFSEYNNKYININDLFTSLIIAGSELITSSKFIELIKEQLPKEKNLSKHILLSKEEFLNINYWFENDKYLNSFFDEKEEEDITKEEKNNKNNNEDESEKTIKIKKIKNSMFEINVEEEKIDLYKIIALLDKLNGVKENDKNNNKKEDDINKEEKEETNVDKEKAQENKEEKIEKDNNNENEIENKEENNIKEEDEKENENKNENEKEKENDKEVEMNKEEENEEEEELNENENKSDKESNKNEETTSNQNESDFIKNNKPNKKNKKKKDEITNNIFNSLFFN